MTEVNMRDIFYVLLTVVSPVVLRCIAQLVSAKVESTRYADAVCAVWAAVEYVNQTFVDSLKAAGKFDEEAKMAAFVLAKDAALLSLSASAQKWLARGFADVDEWFTIQIESAVKGAKEAKRA